ncbi:hypothetical protein KJ853_00410 [Patescibacteria group bacterium]|nr:hypothetical protein [Patescibacteria group bacterium]
MKKEKFITKKYLDKKLDEHTGIITQTIITAVDGVVTKRFAVFGQEMDRKIEKSEERLGKKIDNVQTLIDGYVKAQEDFKEEFVIMKEEVKQMKKVIQEKLGIEIRAI